MVISFFKVSRPASIIALPVIALILWGLALYSPKVPIPESGGPLYRLLHEGLYIFPVMGTFFGLLLLVAGAYLVNRLATANEILNSTTHITALCYVVLMSLTPNQTTFHPSLLSGLFILIILFRLINSHRKEAAYSDYFDIGFLLGLATMVYIPSFVFMPVIWIGLVIIRPFVWREWLAGLIGYLLSFLIALTLFFLFNQDNLLKYDLYLPKWADLPEHWDPGNAEYFTIGSLILVILLSLTRIYGGVTYSVMRAKKNINLILWSGLFGLVSICFAPVINASAFSFVAIAGAIFLSNYMISAKKTGWVNFLFYLLSACSIVHHAVEIFSRGTP